VRRAGENGAASHRGYLLLSNSRWKGSLGLQESERMM
jgi:hypothetical protein